MSNKIDIQNNNIKLQELIEKVSTLSGGGSMFGKNVKGLRLKEQFQSQSHKKLLVHLLQSKWLVLK